MAQIIFGCAKHRRFNTEAEADSVLSRTALYAVRSGLAGGSWRRLRVFGCGCLAAVTIGTSGASGQRAA